MTTCVSQPKPKHLVLVSGTFYYSFVSILLAAVAVSVFWQIEEDTAKIQYTNKSVVISQEDPSFYVDLDFCTPSGGPVEVERYYKNKATDIVYTTPTGVFPMDDTFCLKARIHAYAGELEPGNYVYHVAVNYRINPLREKRQEVALINLEVK